MNIVPMKRSLIIRSETAADIEAIGELTVAALATLDVSDHTEQYVIEALRTAGSVFPPAVHRP